MRQTIASKCRCAHACKYGTCLEPVKAGLRTRFEIVWPSKGFEKDCPARSELTVEGV